ncbi:hypothetical protein RCL_jg28219.t1 [Rhizophagus clarus]|uniref:Uncharacterized protein n=1 Tax=Rhizophagus clarus TaxID=94130 RepID=A0A8H3QVF9_9GLOM|nr:hypothetical protein RCL_jg28219.t1 [Rhizophagus clarus]
MSSNRKLRSSSTSKLEFSITQNTYGLPEGPTAEEIVREILPQTQVKRQRHSSASLNDDNMEEVSKFSTNKVPIAKQIQPEPEILIIEEKNQTNTTNNNDKAINSIKTKNWSQQVNLCYDYKFDPLTEISNELENIDTDIPTKGKNKEQNEIHTTTEIEIININNNERNLSEEFRAFTLKKFFKSYTNKQIHTCIRDKFATTENYKFAKSIITKNNGIEIVIVSFYSKVTRDAIHGIILSNFPATFWKYEPTELTTIINAELEELERHIIKIINVPKHYTIDDIFNIFKLLDKINEITPFTSRKRNIQPPKNLA